MTADRLYLTRLTTAAGNVGHEMVMAVSAAAVAKARQSATDAHRRLLAARDESERLRLSREATAANVARSRAIFDMCEAWIKDRAGLPS